MPPTVFPTGTTIYKPVQCWNGYTDRPVLGSELLRCVGHCLRVSSLPQESMQHEKIVEQNLQRELRTHTRQSMT